MLKLSFLQDKVREVLTTFPWYKELIGGRTPEHIGGLTDLPLMTPDILEDRYYQQVNDAGWSVYRTSGTSSGRRKSIFYSEEDDRRYVEIKTKIFLKLIEGSGCTRALADMGTGHAASTALEIFERMGMEPKSISFELPVEKHIEELQTYRPDLLYTMPSILERIAAASVHPHTFGLRKILLVGEVASLEWQRGMARRFGLDRRDIIDTYGSIELGTMAYYDHDIGRYIVADGLYAEGLGIEAYDKCAEALHEDERILVLTSFVRDTLPALRFVTCDVVRDFRPVCIDGEEKQSFQSIVRRIGPELKHGEKISLHDIEAAVYRHVDDAVLRVEARNNKLTVRIKSHSLTELAIESIRNDIRERIPEIGQMIRGGLLDDIDVIAASEHESWEQGQIKHKRIYHRGVECDDHGLE